MTIKDYADLVFDVKNNSFNHNLEIDLACFAIWKSARTYLDQIRKLFSENFEILLETQIVWTKENFHNNANRLYEAPVIQNRSNKSNHAKKIGDANFILFVLKDNKPKYSYAKSVSGKIELTNLNFVKTKYIIRNWVKKDKGIKYAVHSTNNIYEFFFQVPLLLGLDMFQQLLSGKKLDVPVVAKDLEGAEGWESYEKMFNILNVTCNYLVLRGFEELPEGNSEKDLDILTDNYQRFASAVGASQKEKQPYKGYINVAESQISLDMRFVGDKYYFTSWAQKMLNTKQKRNDVFVPRIDHYFFSLLYHSKVQKPRVKNKYYDILEGISRELQFDWFDKIVLDQNKDSGKILDGYLRSEGYYYERPIDKGVFENSEVIKFLPHNPGGYKQSPFYEKIKKEVLKKLSPRTKYLLKKILKS